MDNKLTQDYKDNLYEKVLEKKAKRTAKRKRLASICVVFFIVACFATYGYTKYEKENYNNYFITESENIYIDDEYEYFDDLGIKLEFINTDKDSITIGVNIKYEDIAECLVIFEEICINDELENIQTLNRKNELSGLKEIEYNYKIINKNELICIIDVEKKSENVSKEFNINLKQCCIENRKKQVNKKIDMNYNKKISIEE